MKKIPVGALIASITISLLLGGVVGFFLGIASTNAGARFLQDLIEDEQQSDIRVPRKLNRERFELLYPANWKIDMDDEDYDPDYMFSIESPGASFVMFVMGNMATNPEDSLQDQINSFSKLMGSPSIEPFETYGQIQGKGATLRGRIMGINVTIKAFACYTQGMTAIIVQQYPDEDVAYVEAGLRLIEESFILRMEGNDPTAATQQRNQTE